MRVAVAQVAPFLLDRERTTAKVCDWITRAAEEGAGLVCFGETLIPAYPVWLSRANGAAFESTEQKAVHARYLREGVCLEEGHLQPLQNAAKKHGIHVVCGVAERLGHTIYCTAVTIGADGELRNTHRKLMPTYEERLAWGQGDGSGLNVMPVGEFRLGTLNCWENWMPLPRTALYQQGMNLHVMLWPGCERLTQEITRFVARESRSYVVSASALLRREDLPEDFELADLMGEEDVYYDGGSAIAGPDGEWVVPPQVGSEQLVVADLDLDRVYEERQNFDPAGHYARPDVFTLDVNRG